MIRSCKQHHTIVTCTSISIWVSTSPDFQLSAPLTATPHLINFSPPSSLLTRPHTERAKMTSLTSSLQDLLSSILNVFRSIFATVFSLFESVTAVFTNLVTSVFDFARGLVGFLLSMFWGFSLSFSRSLRFPVFFSGGLNGKFGPERSFELIWA